MKVLAIASMACVIATGLSAGLAFGQHAPSVRGSLDAVTVMPGATTQPASATMPAGHPHVASAEGDGVMPGHPGGMETIKTGALRVLISQGTKGGPAIGKDAVRVDLLSRGTKIKTYQTTVGEGGVVELRDLPLEVPFQPVISVLHAGAEEQMVGAPMHKFQPAVELEMPVYELTSEKPAWTMGMRHVMAEPVAVEGGGVALKVTEMLGGYNPTDRAWTGQERGDGRTTVEVELPEGATDVQFGPGMLEAGARVEKGKVVRGKTMLPGSTQYVFGYTMAVTGGKARLSFTAPADTTLFALYVPGGAKIEKLDGLMPGKASGTHEADSRQLLKANGIKTGQVVGVELSDVKAPPPPTTKPAALEQTTDLHLPVPATTPGADGKK